MVNTPFFEEVLEGIACELSAVIRAESFELLLTLSFSVRQPFLELGDYLVLGFEQQYPPVASGIISDGSKVLVAVTACVEGPTYINVHKCKLLFHWSFLSFLWVWFLAHFPPMTVFTSEVRHFGEWHTESQLVLHQVLHVAVAHVSKSLVPGEGCLILFLLNSVREVQCPLTGVSDVEGCLEQILFENKVQEGDATVVDTHCITLSFNVHSCLEEFCQGYE